MLAPDRPDYAVVIDIEMQCENCAASLPVYGASVGASVGASIVARIKGDSAGS